MIIFGGTKGGHFIKWSLKCNITFTAL